MVGLDRGVGDVLDLGALCVGQRTGRPEVEPQVPGAVERTGLRRTGTQDLAQRGTDEVGAGVALGRAAAMVRVDRGEYDIADGELPASTVTWWR